MRTFGTQLIICGAFGRNVIVIVGLSMGKNHPHFILSSFFLDFFLIGLSTLVIVAVLILEHLNLCNFRL